MKGYVENIEQLAKENSNFRKVLYTARYSQLVLMSLLPGEEIGAETHGLDQFFRVESGTGKAILDGIEHPITDGFVVVIPAGTLHNIVNTSTTEPMKLYTLYSPPDHEDALIHPTKADAIASDKPFNGKTTE
jgi:mannose-6-phosphate isomerase-like protein (cupin superfamily)